MDAVILGEFLADDDAAVLQLQLGLPVGEVEMIDVVAVAGVHADDVRGRLVAAQVDAR